MRPAIRPHLFVGSLVLLPLFVALSAQGATPSAEQALRLKPIQGDVEFDRPDAAQTAKCAISAQKIGGNVGWVVKDPDGVILRQFVDTNGDNVVDQWSYHKDGLEVYRDIDSDFNNKADQYRWFHTGGSRWAMDKNEDGKIDAWKAISAEEVTAEVVAALAARDAARFSRVVLSATELKSLGLGPEKAKELDGRLEGILPQFKELATQQKEIVDTTKWVQFSGNRPGIVPAGMEGSTKDLRVYENVVAVVETGAEHGQVHIGTLVEVGNVWRVVDVPRLISNGQGQLASSGLFFRSPLDGSARLASTGPSEETQELLTELEKLDAATSQATSVAEQAKFHARRADLLVRIAEQSGSPEDRVMWLRQLADMVSAAVQSGEYPDGVKRLEALFERLQKSKKDKELVAYVQFRQLMADYGLSVQTASTEQFAKIHAAWLKSLEKYADDYPETPDAAEAMLQLAIAQEYGGEEAEAKKWYGRVVGEFPSSPQAKKAAGARARLESVGKQISLEGKSPSGDVVRLAAFRGKVVLIQYWASWCEPCKSDMSALKDLLTKYGRSGFGIIGVNLDNSPKDMAAYLADSPLPWPQIFEEGGLDSRPANELGILTLPTMILIDQEGKVVNRNVQVAELDRALNKLMR